MIYLKEKMLESNMGPACVIVLSGFHDCFSRSREFYIG